jgi:uncharacterized protein YbaR (Trm112 family)
VFIELIDLLRCVNPHNDTWLVASFNTVSNRFVEEGKLGCPVCSAQYPIHAGVADFAAGVGLPDCEHDRALASHRREELATRAGAYLNATEPGTTVVLGGLWAYAAEALSEMAHVRVLTLNASGEVSEAESVGMVRVGSQIPLAGDSVWGVALDAWFPAAIVESAVRIVKPGGRIVGPTNIEAPAELIVLARDENYWVGEKAPRVVPLERRGRSSGAPS